MNQLRMKSHGFFAGDFVITTEDRSFSIGDYIKVVLTKEPYFTGEVIKGFRNQELPIIAFPLTILACRNTDEIKIEVILQIPVGISAFHWYICSEINEISIVESCKYQNRKFTWYMPKIDGRVPSLGEERVG